ncbi:MAG: SDR family oxidoreductase [Actinobacteria bacterium]|nr:SDR family oxidoreductase [Actinomycetota bacterium]
MRGLENRVALVSGGGGGIGAATTHRLVEEGAKVLVADLDLAKARSAADVAGGSGQASAIDLDVTDADSWSLAVAKAEDLFGALHILVNAAGILRDKSALKMSEAEWGPVIDVHLKAPWLGARASLSLMREAGWGRIVNVSSVSAFGAFGQSNYAAAKAGVIGLTKTLALESARFGVNVNAVMPGAVDTEMAASLPPEVRQAGIEQTPLRREARPDEAAAAIAFLASEEASFITGEILVVDGGWTLG